MIRKSHGTETRFRSLFELRPRYPTLPDDGQQRTDGELAVIWDGNRDTAGIGAALHDDVTSALAHLDEPVLLKDRQTSRPDRTRSLPMSRFDPRYKDIGPKPTLDLVWIGTLEEQLDCLSQVGSRLFDRRPLTGHVQLGAQRRVQVSLLLDDRCVHRGRHSDPPGCDGDVLRRPHPDSTWKYD
jgi:hypothetical protein